MLGIHRMNNHSIIKLFSFPLTLRQMMAPKIIEPPIIEYTDGASPIPMNTQTGLNTASSVAIIIDSVAETYFIPSLNII